jgi:hypothetical protein
MATSKGFPTFTVTEDTLRDNNVGGRGLLKAIWSLYGIRLMFMSPQMLPGEPQHLNSWIRSKHHWHNNASVRRMLIDEAHRMQR